MLPGETNAAMHLDVELCAEVRGRHRERRCHRRGEGQLVVVGLGGTRRVPHRRRCQLSGHEHVGAVMLDRLVGRDRTAELQSNLGVLARQLCAFTSDACGFGGQDHSGEIDEHLPGAPHDVCRRAIEGDPSRPASRVDVLRRLDLHAAPRRVDDRNVVPRSDEKDVRDAAAEHHTGNAVRGAVAELHRACECDRSVNGAIGEPGEQACAHVGGRGCGDDGAGDHRRHERSRRDGSTELLDDDHELGKSESRTPVLFGQVQSEPAELAEVSPELGQRLSVRLEQGSCRTARVALQQEVRRGLGQCTMVVGDGNRH